MKEVWNIYTGKSEYTPLYKDKFGRFPLGLNQHNLFDPIVSRSLFTLGFRPQYPNNKKMAVCISHDVDKLFYETISINQALKSTIRFLIKGDTNRLYEILKRYFRKKNHKEEVQQFLKIHNRYDIKSTYFFLALDEGEEDFNYRLNEIGDVLELLKEEGNEIGLHGGHKCFNNITKIIQEKSRLEKYADKVVAYRGHYLKFEVPLTWELLSKAGFRYDTTYGHAQSIGFRNGMCYPFNPFLLHENEFMPLIELPLMVMDETLFNVKYMGLDERSSLKVVYELINRVEEVNGVFTLLWHNSTIGDPKYREVYNKILDYMIKKDAWITTGGELIDWWKLNNYFDIMNKMLLQIKVKN